MISWTTYELNSTELETSERVTVHYVAHASWEAIFNIPEQFRRARSSNSVWDRPTCALCVLPIGRPELEPSGYITA